MVVYLATSAAVPVARDAALACAALLASSARPARN